MGRDEIPPHQGGDAILRVLRPDRDQLLHRGGAAPDGEALDELPLARLQVVEAGLHRRLDGRRKRKRFGVRVEVSLLLEGSHDLDDEEGIASRAVGDGAHQGVGQ